MKRRRFEALRCYLVSCILAIPAAGFAATIDAVRVEQHSDRTRVVFDVSAPVTFQVFTLANPDRVVVDLPRTRPGAVDLSGTDVRGSGISQVRGGPRGDGYRVVLDLAQPCEPQGFLQTPAAAHGDRLVVDLREHAVQRAVASPRAASAPPLRDFVVAIDAGHGGDDPGAIGVGGVQEKSVALAIARQLAGLLQQTPGFRGELTRSGDYYLTLRQRTTVARKRRADLFVSIHADAFSGADARGASVYTLSAKGATNETARWLAEKENASDLIGGVGDVSLDDKDAVLAHVLLDLSMDANRSASIEAAAAVLDALNDFARLHRGRVEQAGFVVLKSPDIPSMLVETGYLSNPTESRKLSQSAYQRQIARAIFDGITAYARRHPPANAAVAQREPAGSNDATGVTTQ
jgi:N-acetylmuramoyl-L-alanine amidase